MAEFGHFFEKKNDFDMCRNHRFLPVNIWKYSFQKRSVYFRFGTLVDVVNLVSD